MQLLNGVQLLNLTFLLALLTAALPSAVFGTVIVPSICMYGVLHLILLLYVPCNALFILTQFLVLNLDDWFVVSSDNLLFFDIPLLCYIIL